ncbi:IS110-like element ISSlo1 family transposase [Shewanella loihica]|uniref:Transposase IS116/IS110/IS902 family protein n=1 Tax=Shewanella loihica (strain ATCC BAA-1088 / PV-4) TaxID=323850 RepID=A3QBF1_SHELP|nr:IS110-like element ISSlo1 family transposase [Shewanella loihica]ABO22799.1 transposase IS116/IS110/IS902 family protein [Shewanella loihica PV-4]ABO23012.1 transposase IS116/IS110/IS902 family protein [Shewanella loihica PV-4]ABO24139.1 transposase IS116/IS110/IS902 family protein [Shewanella loihica PV-4]ABO24875.1 transposase IS116/IS110/IS902 family protein [Shewanella loihica PV-4]ABO25418.1 transposase IS116/IS110/IS902 family protein [Shewanella loihica PV-4]
MKVTLIGIDLAKNVLQVCGVNQVGKTLFNRTVKRTQLLKTLVQYPDAVIAMEACSGSNYWGRELLSRGFEVKLIPPQHVKPFVKGNKNDRNDAFAICEAAMRPNIIFVKPRTLAQVDIIISHRIRERRIRVRTALTNQIRGLLSEYGIVIPKGRDPLNLALPELLEDADNSLTTTARRYIRELLDELYAINASIKALEKEIRLQARNHEDTKRLTAIRGVAEIIATASVSFAGDGSGYQNGRHFSANLGLVPKEFSSGGKQKLGAITKRGNSYLRRQLIQGAWSVIRYAKNNDDRLSVWARKVIERRGKQKAAVAVANKLARIIWAMLYYKTEYRPS